MQRISLADDLLDTVLSGRKRSTIRRGIRSYELGAARLVTSSASVDVRITAVRVATMQTLDAEDVEAEGCETGGELVRVLQRFYPDLRDDEPLTVIRFARRD